MAKHKDTQDEGAEGQTAVVEKDVDVELLEKNLAETKKPALSVSNGNGKHGLGRDQFLFAAKGYKPKIEIVDLPDVEGLPPGSQVKVRELRAGERDDYENKIVKGRLGNQKIDLGELRIGLVIKSCVQWDNEDEPLFQPDDAKWLRQMGISVIQAIYNVASKLSAVSKEDEEELAGK